MKKLVAILMGGIFAASVSSAFAGEIICVKCHKSMDKVAQNIKKSGAKSADELVDFLRNKSAKKAIHKAVKDEDIKKAFEEVSKK
ncbi:MAG: hypothetical protein ACP5HI_01145 [Caldimicrobium sp.]|jgi:hypothetical protein